jgi:hypothetical protein
MKRATLVTARDSDAEQTLEPRTMMSMGERERERREKGSGRKKDGQREHNRPGNGRVGGQGWGAIYDLTRRRGEREKRDRERSRREQED